MISGPALLTSSRKGVWIERALVESSLFNAMAVRYNQTSNQSMVPDFAKHPEALHGIRAHLHHIDVDIFSIPHYFVGIRLQNGSRHLRVEFVGFGM